MWNDLLDLTFVETVWAEAVEIDSVMLEALFIAANEVCVAYAPPVYVGYAVPMSYKLAEIMQAKHIWTQFGAGNNQETGPDGYVIPSYPLVFSARDLLRPKRNPLSRLR